MARTFTLLVMTWLALLIAACADDERAARPVVLAAASLQDGLEEAADIWASRGNPRPILSFAGTSALARQVEAGAPADMFISADEGWMDAVEAIQLLRPSTRASFLANRLVLVAPATSGGQLAVTYGFPLAAALGGGRLAMADPDAIPAGRYGKQALIRLGVWTTVQDRIATAENVRAALALVARGEAPLGIVYATDAQAETDVRVVAPFPESSHRPITYQLALLKVSASPTAEAFRRFLLSPEAQAVFRRHGFETPDKP